MNSDGVEIADQRPGQWVYWDRIRISLPDPDRAPRLMGNRAMEDEGERRYAFEPVTVTFRFLWDAKRHHWGLYSVDASGSRVLDDGPYDGADMIHRTFFDPLDDDPANEGKAPDWLIRLADERVGLIPAPLREEAF